METSINSQLLPGQKVTLRRRMRTTAGNAAVKPTHGAIGVKAAVFRKERDAGDPDASVKPKKAGHEAAAKRKHCNMRFRILHVSDFHIEAVEPSTNLRGRYGQSIVLTSLLDAVQDLVRNG